MTEPKFSMIHKTDLCEEIEYEEEIIDGFAIYAFLTYSDCEESARHQAEDGSDTEEDETINECKRTPKGVSFVGCDRNYRHRRRSRSGSRSSIGDTPTLHRSFYLERRNKAVNHRSASRKPGRPKGSINRSRIQIKHQIHSELCDPSIDTDQLDCLYNDYLQDRLREEEENKYKFTMPRSMDENFVSLSLDALDSSCIREEPCIPTELIKEELNSDAADEIGDHRSERDSSDKVSMILESDADVTEMISRHSKREIRLPARYHQSGLLMGSQWVIPDYDSDEMTPKKKLKTDEDSDEKISHPEEQRIVRPLTPLSDFKVHSQPQESPQPQSQPLYSYENQRIFPFNSISTNSDQSKEDEKSLSSDLCNESRESVVNVQEEPKLNSSFKTCSPHISQLKLHQEKLEKLQLLRKQQEMSGKMIENSCNVITGSTFKVYSNVTQNVPQAINIVSPATLSVTNNFLLLPPSIQPSDQFNQQSLSTPSSNSNSDQSMNNLDNSDLQTQKDAKLQELRQLYRDLYFENKPERRLIYAKSRVKPRVNKKAEVEEAIKVIERLTKREKQLDYIKKLLSMWNKKLNLAAKVINDKDVIPKAIEVVQDVLKTYQASKSYKVTEAWDTLSKPKTSSLVAAINPVTPQLAVKPELSVRPEVSVIRSTGPLTSRIMVKPQSHLISSQESRTTPVTLPMTSTLTKNSPSFNVEHSSNFFNGEKSPGVSMIAGTPMKIQATAPQTHLQPFAQPFHHHHHHHNHHHQHQHLPAPPSIQTSISLAPQARLPIHQPQLPLTPLSNPHHPALLPTVQQHSQANLKQIPVLMSQGTLNHNNLFSSPRSYGNRTMPRVPLANTVTPVSPGVISPGVTTKPTIIKPTTFLLTPNAGSPTSPVYRILVKGDTINRVLLSPQITPHIYKKSLLREPFLGPVLESPVEVSVQSDNQGCN